MKQNLLKYGLMMVLAMIASTGLLWADCCVEVVHDTCYVEKIDSLRINLSVKQAVNAYCESETQEEVICWFTKILQYVKEYKKEILFIWALGLLLVLSLILGLKQFLYRDKDASENEKRKAKDIEVLCVAAFVVVCLWIDTTWFYLILASVLLYYVDKWEICPDLLAGLANVIKLLQGKLDISNQPAEDQQQELEKEAEQEYEQVTQDTPEEVREVSSKDIWIKQRMSDGERVEHLALDWYEKQYPALQRNVRLRLSPTKRVNIDGLFLGEDKNIIIDVRYCIHSIGQLLNYKLDYLYEAANYLRQKTGYITGVILCVVVADEKQRSKAYGYFKQSNINNIELQVYTEEELQKLKGK